MHTKTPLTEAEIIERFGYKRILFPFVDGNFNPDYHEKGPLKGIVVDRVAVAQIETVPNETEKYVLINYDTGENYHKSKILDFLKPLKIFEFLRMGYDVEDFVKEWDRTQEVETEKQKVQKASILTETNTEKILEKMITEN